MIINPGELADVEQQVSAARYTQLGISTLPGAYDAAHLLMFHRKLFADVYDWAGTTRTVNIAKDAHPFCLAPNIDSELDALFAGLANDQYLLHLDRKAFVSRLAELYGDMNAIHPFREGNGRAQRAFLRQLAAGAGWTLWWDNLDRDANNGACHRYRHHFDPEEMAALLDPLILRRGNQV